jgi:transposase
MLEEYTTEKQYSLIRILWAKGLTAKDIHKEMFPVYYGECLSRRVVHSWVKKFSQGHWKIIDDARPGRPVEIATEATMQQVKEFIRTDRSMTIDSVATAVGCSHGLEYSIMHDHLKFQKVHMVRAQRTEEFRKI